MAKAKQSGGRRSSGGRKPTQRKQAAPPMFELALRPEHQRELFAITLIAIAAITVIFFATGTAGVIGAGWVALTRQLLGWGALIVPLALGLLGVAILWQERREDIRLSGATVLGTILVLMALLVLLEFALGPRQSTDEQVGAGGGWLGYHALDLLAQAIGRPATFVLVCVLALAGIMLTFDITLYELTTGMRDSFGRFWTIVASAPNNRPQRAQPSLPQLPRDPDFPYVPPPAKPNDDDIGPTPIAERMTKRKLFERPEIKTGAPIAPETAGVPRAPAIPKPAELKPIPVKPATEAVLANLLAGPPATATTIAQVPIVQEALDGFDVPPEHRAWPLPSFDMLDHYTEGTITDDERRSKSRLIEETLASFKVEAQVVGVNTGPAVTQFELQPAVGVKVNKITSLDKDLMLALAAPSLRIEAPIPGKNSIGIEIPNSAISTVGMRDVVESDEFESAKGKLKVALGKDVSGTPIVMGLERMPHLLMAGATGSGKSAGINSIICALLLKYTPDELKFIMVDPKMVELIVYNRIPHLLSPVVTELERVVPTLKWATREMERRYKIFAKHGFRNIDSYKQAARKRADLEPIPYIIIIIDELADLMMMAPDEVETLICRLAQMARATGIHLIIATQRPSVDVVTGLIKANFPSRMAFAVTSQIDSRVILDMNGAEQLLGRGDMLFMASDAARPVRIQGTWVSDAEVERIVSFWRNALPPEAKDKDTATRGRTDAGTTGEATKANEPNLPPSGDNLNAPGEYLSTNEQDELLPEAVKLVQQHRRASASLLQRRLRIGYSKAAQLIDLLEQQGIVGPAEDGRSREVLGRDEE
ncbi:MAG: DNA translocase FtsK 4TM domain-containing protein [Roseiflexaceae bacterium]|nr:DNA translocase FtsK 4TM domain-containing protein [Roseiflexaceae bacterium]